MLGLTLAGFVLASLAGVALVWVAAAGALTLALPTGRQRRPGPKSLGPRARFIVDHAPRRALLVWPAP